MSTKSTKYEINFSERLMMSRFRIIAIKTPTKKQYASPSYDYLKILKFDTIYQFYKDYTFSNGLKEIQKDSVKMNDLYSIQYKINKDVIKTLPVNVSAIIGTNGSGKSSLAELLYLICFCVGYKMNKSEFLKTQKDCNSRNKVDYEKLFNEITLEIIYTTDLDNQLLCMSIKNGNINIYQYKYSSEDNKYFFDNNLLYEIANFDTSLKSESTDKYNLSVFFYSIVLSYSHYSLNSLDIGDWLNPLFHKNDGYQTPIVLNPKRDDGNIDINKENNLLKRRLFANLLEPVKTGFESNSLRNLGNDKIVDGTIFVCNPVKYTVSLDAYRKHDKKREFIEAIKYTFNFDIEKNKDNLSNIEQALIGYIYLKVEKVIKGYSDYKNQYLSNEGEIINLRRFFEDLKLSKSHIIFKIKGTLLFLKYYRDFFSKYFTLTNKKSQLGFFKISLNDYCRIISKIKIKIGDVIYINNFMMAPSGIFDVDFYFFEKESQNGSYTLESLSSGEKQMIHSISSIVYHIINIDSVESSNLRLREIDKLHNLIKFKFINIVLDEIELYFHPEWQREFLYNLLDYISKMNEANLSGIKGINILLLTHSPFILSDIPSSNLLQLSEGNIVDSELSETFGANIHDLLRNDFFLKEGYIGKFARNNINRMIETINQKDNLTDEEFTSLENNIDIIGEPILKRKIQEMFYEKFKDKIEFHAAIIRIQEEAEKLGYNLLKK